MDGSERKGGFLSRPFARLIRDERDLPFVRLALLMTVVFWPLAIYLFVPGRFSWWLAPIYWALYLFFLGPFVLMLHNTSHRPLFKREYGWLNRYIPWVVGPLIGMAPETYFSHHMGMHHKEGNLHEDLSSTMRYQRDSFAHFMRFYVEFLFLGGVQLVGYLRARGRDRLATRFIVGETAYMLATVLALLVNWRVGLVVFAVPLVLTRFLLMAGNWAQHAFVDPDQPANDWRSVVTFINSKYNHRCFNDGYHIGHHLKASRHWLEMPADFLANRQRLVDENALVFEKIDYFIIFVLLMTKQHERLARYRVNLDPNREYTFQETVATMKARLAPIGP